METLDAYSQKQVKLPVSGKTVTITELDAMEAQRFLALLMEVGAGALIAFGTYKRNSGGGVDLHLGAGAQGAIDRLCQRPELLQELVKASIVDPAYSDDWYKLTFRARNLPDLYHLANEIIVWNFADAADFLKKKATRIIGGLLQLVELQTATN